MAEGGGLLNRYTPQRRIEGSNPSVSASWLVRIDSESVPVLIWVWRLSEVRVIWARSGARQHKRKIPAVQKTLFIVFRRI